MPDVDHVSDQSQFFRFLTNTLKIEWDERLPLRLFREDEDGENRNDFFRFVLSKSIVKDQFRQDQLIGGGNLIEIILA